MSDNSIRKILGESASNKTPENPVENDEYQAFSYGRVGTRPQLMIVFRKADGYCEAFPYSHLTHITSSKLGHELTLDFGARKIAISGQNLFQLFLYLTQNRVVEISQINMHDRFSECEKQTIVDEIRVSSRSY